MSRPGTTLHAFISIAGVAASLSFASLSLAEDHAQKIRLGLCEFRPSFVEEFKDFKVSAWTNTDRHWIAHTPWAGDFGDAAFSDPGPRFPFTLQDGTLRIEALKDVAGNWHSGLLASADNTGVGFKQTYGYFEIKAKLPPGDGLWPAFWLATSQPRGSHEPSIEIDIFEYYGRFPDGFHSVLHVWDSAPGHHNRSADHMTKVPSGALYKGFHTYGADVEPDWISFYFDRQQSWRVATPPEHKKPLLILVDLALGSGWPIDKAPSPSVLEIAYIHAYERGANQCN